MDKKEYKYELHLHTSETSRCGKVSGAEAVKIYKEKGYDGIVVTDHYSPMTFVFQEAFNPQNYIDKYIKGYKAAKAAAGDDFTVLLGMELRFFATIDDFLVYGVTEDFLRNSGNLMKLYLKKFYEMAKKEGYIVLEAHPCRPLHNKWNPEYLDGCEVFNGKDTGKKSNDEAKKWAEESGFKIVSSGSDFHNYPHAARGGIITHEPIKTNDDLLRILRSGEYKLIEG